MCTLALSLRTDRRWPIVAATNRDERLDRPAEDWAVRTSAAGARYVAPRDLGAGGTWMGVSDCGLFAALTNVHVAGFPDPRRISRGLLVTDALAYPDAAAAREALGRLDPAAYNPFHLVVADPERAFLWRYDGTAGSFHELGAGLHVITESEHDGRSPRAERVGARWPLRPDPPLLLDVLAQHAASPRDGTCIHLDPRYGTRSSAIVRLGPSLAASDLFVTTGRPCATPLEDRSQLLAELARHA